MIAQGLTKSVISLFLNVWLCLNRQSMHQLRRCPASEPGQRFALILAIKSVQASTGCALLRRRSLTTKPVFATNQDAMQLYSKYQLDVLPRIHLYNEIIPVMGTTPNAFETQYNLTAARQISGSCSLTEAPYRIRTKRPTCTERSVGESAITRYR